MRTRSNFLNIKMIVVTFHSTEWVVPFSLRNKCCWRKPLLIPDLILHLFECLFLRLLKNFKEKKYSKYLLMYYLPTGSLVYLHAAKLLAPNQKGSLLSIFAFFKALNCSIEDISINIPSVVLVKHWL
jgi:hypothetical protein